MVEFSPATRGGGDGPGFDSWPMHFCSSFIFHVPARVHNPPECATRDPSQHKSVPQRNPNFIRHVVSSGCTRYAHGPIRPCLTMDRMTQCLDFVAPDPNLELHTLGGYGLLVPGTSLNKTKMASQDYSKVCQGEDGHHLVLHQKCSIIFALNVTSIKLYSLSQ